MPAPITLPIATDPAELEAIAFDYLEAVIPGWSRSRGDAMTQVVQATARLIAEGRYTASDVPLAVFRYLGRWVDNLPPVDATPAQTTATVTALDDAGYTIADGTRFEVRTSGDAGIAFVAVGDTVIAPGATSTTTGAVALIAETPGAAGSGLPTSSVVVPVDALAWIDAVELEQITTGGVDAETDDAYIARWVLLRQLSNDTPILADDAAALVRALIPGVGRTVGLDNYNPADDTFGNEKYVTIAAHDLQGEPLSTGQKTTAVALLEARRELNFVMSVIDATYTPIDVDVAFTTHAGFDVAATEAAVEAALAAYLHPAASGIPFDGGVDEWVPDTHVRYLELAAVIDRVTGVNVITGLQLARVQLVTAIASTDVLTATGHDLAVDDQVVFAGLAGGAPLAAGTTYYARDITTDTFKVAATAGGAAINLTTDLTDGTLRSLASADVPLAQPAPLTRPGAITATGSGP